MGAAPLEEQVSTVLREHRFSDAIAALTTTQASGAVGGRRVATPPSALGSSAAPPASALQAEGHEGQYARLCALALACLITERRL